MPYDNDDWPSEDGATAVEEHDGAGVAEDESGHSETSDTANDPASATSSSHPPAQLPMSLTKIFDSGVSVSVNGEPWLQVVMGDRGPDEAFVVVYGLLPDRDYEILLCVGKDEAVVLAQTSSVAALNPKSLSDKGRSMKPGKRAFIRMLTSDASQRNFLIAFDHRQCRRRFDSLQRSLAHLICQRPSSICWRQSRLEKSYTAYTRFSRPNFCAH